MSAGLAGCTVGPDFHRPAVQVPGAFHAAEPLAEWYHETARLLFRIKVGVQMAKLVADPDFDAWLALLADMTFTALDRSARPRQTGCGQ